MLIEYIAIFILFLILGIIIFPILFFFQHLFKLPIPDLEKDIVHIHHSSYGIALILIGLTVFPLNYYYLSSILLGLGIGFIIHHELTEKDLKGLEKFIYIKKK